MKQDQKKEKHFNKLNMYLIFMLFYVCDVKNSKSALPPPQKKNWIRPALQCKEYQLSWIYKINS